MNFLNVRAIILELLVFNIASSFKDFRTLDFRSTTIPFDVDSVELAYREFTFVTAKNITDFQEVTIPTPSVTQSVFLTGKNSTSSFFTKLISADHYEVPFTILTFALENISEAAELINQISVFYEKTCPLVSECPNYPIMIRIPVKSNSKPIKAEIQNLILPKVKPDYIHRLILDSSIFLAFTSNNGTVQEIWELYSIKDKIFLNPVNAKLDLVNGQLFEESSLLRRQNWEGTEVVCGMHLTANEMGEIVGNSRFEATVRQDSNGSYQLESGMSTRIANYFETSLNFTRKVLHPYKEYETLSLMAFFEKYQEQLDLLVTHHGLNPERSKRITYLFPTYFDSVTAYFVQPPAHTFRNIYITPFAPTMWACIFITWIVITLSFKLIAHVRAVISEPSFWSDEVEMKEKERDTQVTKEVVWWAIAAACQQGWYMTPASTSARSIFLTGLIFSLLCYAAYTATIVSELWDNIVPIKSLESLISNSEEIYLTEGSDINSFIYQAHQRDANVLKKFQMSDMKTAFKKVTDTKRGTSMVIDWPEYFLEVAKEMTMNNSKRESRVGDEEEEVSNPEMEFCEHVKHLRYEYVPSNAAMFVRKNSPFRKTFNYRILSGIEQGIFRRYWKEYLVNTRIRCLDEANKTYALGIYDTWMVFMVLLMGYGSSIFILGLEILYKRRMSVSLKMWGEIN